jgi:hypothetical protein
MFDYIREAIEQDDAAVADYERWQKLQRLQRGPDDENKLSVPSSRFDVLLPDGSWNPANPRKHKSSATMNRSEHSAWIEAGRPPLEGEKAAKQERVHHEEMQVMIRREIQQTLQARARAVLNASVEARLDNLATVMGEELAKAENRIHAKHEEDIQKLRDQLLAVREPLHPLLDE